MSVRPGPKPGSLTRIAKAAGVAPATIRHDAKRFLDMLEADEMAGVRTRAFEAVGDGTYVVVYVRTREART